MKSATGFFIATTSSTTQTRVPFQQPVREASVVCRASKAKDRMEWQADYFRGHAADAGPPVSAAWKKLRGHPRRSSSIPRIAALSTMRLGPAMRNRPGPQSASSLRVSLLRSSRSQSKRRRFAWLSWAISET